MVSEDLTTIPNAQNPSPSVNTSILNSASHFVTIKLSIDKYLLWKAQMLPFFKGHQLYGHVDGTTPMPSPMVHGGPNLEHSQCLSLDQLILSALNSSLTDQVLS